MKLIYVMIVVALSVLFGAWAAVGAACAWLLDLPFSTATDVVRDKPLLLLLWAGLFCWSGTAVSRRRSTT